MFRQFQNLTLGEAFFSLKMLYLQLGRTDVRILKRSFNFWLFSDIWNSILKYTCIFTKNCPHKFRLGFKFWSSLGSGCKNSKTAPTLDFFEIVLKVEKNTKDLPVKWNQIKFKGDSLVIFFRGPINL